MRKDVGIQRTGGIARASRRGEKRLRQRGIHTANAAATAERHGRHANVNRLLARRAEIVQSSRQRQTARGVNVDAVKGDAE